MLHWLVFTPLHLYVALFTLGIVWTAVQGWVLYCVHAMAEYSQHSLDSRGNSAKMRVPLPVFAKNVNWFILAEMALHTVFAFAVLAMGHYVAFGFHMPFLLYNLRQWAEKEYGFDFHRIGDMKYMRRRRLEIMVKFVFTIMWTLLSLAVCGVWLLSFLSHHYKRWERIYRKIQMFLYKLRALAHAPVV
eukprot:TRINITY_DN105669_c0_g1_i1.p1 TRINITY_DN105669_c0_g1~~TRINITY_DN105669_c0_g1_i1.p1  ORF type:complete len:188 (+),score=67.12 TRINITY_DN105669_c0_g1_i1:87-650(+)